MVTSNALKMLCGSAMVYVIMAACGSADTRPPGGAMGNDSGSSPDAVSGTHDGASGEATLLDAVTDPVPNAMADVVQSGTRLKAHYYAGEDGSKQFTMTFLDTQRNEDCSFQIGGDGVVRCLPSGGTVLYYYADSACTQLLAGVPIGCTAPKYATTGASTCPDARGGRQIYQLGAAFTADTNLYVMSTTCLLSSAASNFRVTYDLYLVEAEIPPSSFAQATLQTDP
jgi:hypothetical protein